jgi:hypothetical protein
VRMSKKKVGLHCRRYRDASYLIRESEQAAAADGVLARLKHLNLERKSNQVGRTDSVSTDKADERLRALPMLFSEPVATHRRLLRNKLR